jgi:hypothetical protein
MRPYRQHQWNVKSSLDKIGFQNSCIEIRLIQALKKFYTGWVLKGAIFFWTGLICKENKRPTNWNSS